jgi:hypothetical protein
VRQTDSLVLATDAPMRHTDPPILATHAPMRHTDPPILETHAPVRHTDPPVPETAAPVRHTDGVPEPGATGSARRAPGRVWLAAPNWMRWRPNPRVEHGREWPSVRP